MTGLSEIIIIAGPNGAGKSTFAENFLSAQLRNYSFINAAKPVSIASSIPSTLSPSPRTPRLMRPTRPHRISS